MNNAPENVATVPPLSHDEGMAGGCVCRSTAAHHRARSEGPHHGDIAATLDRAATTAASAPKPESTSSTSRQDELDQRGRRIAEGDVMPTLNAFDVGDTRTTAAILGDGPADDPLLPLGLDSHRYRCCGNGVVSNVSEWIGVRLAEALA